MGWVNFGLSAQVHHPFCIDLSEEGVSKILDEVDRFAGALHSVPHVELNLSSDFLQQLRPIPLRLKRQVHHHHAFLDGLQVVLPASFTDQREHQCQEGVAFKQVHVHTVLELAVDALAHLLFVRWVLTTYQGE